MKITVLNQSQKYKIEVKTGVEQRNKATIVQAEQTWAINWLSLRGERIYKLGVQV